MMELTEFVEEFEKLKGDNEFKPQLFDGIKGFVILSGEGYIADANGILRVAAPNLRRSDRIRIYVETASFQIETPTLNGEYLVERIKEEEMTRYSFTLENEKGDELRICTGVYDTDLEP